MLIVSRWGKWEERELARSGVGKIGGVITTWEHILAASGKGLDALLV